MRVRDGVQVFTLSEVIMGDLMYRQPSEVISEVRKWCHENDAVYGVGEEATLVETTKGEGRSKLVIAEV